MDWSRSIEAIYLLVSSRSIIYRWLYMMMNYANYSDDRYRPYALDVYLRPPGTRARGRCMPCLAFGISQSLKHACMHDWPWASAGRPAIWIWSIIRRGDDDVRAPSGVESSSESLSILSIYIYILFIDIIHLSMVRPRSSSFSSSSSAICHY